jgi:hypothetical protein
MAQLSDKRGPLFNEPDFIPTQQPELFDQRILRTKWPPILTVDTQSVGKTVSSRSICECELILLELTFLPVSSSVLSLRFN